ncbi:MAG: hypothetical protein Q9163_002626 [Psora crenata]
MGRYSTNQWVYKYLDPHYEGWKEFKVIVEASLFTIKAHITSFPKIKNEFGNADWDAFAVDLLRSHSREFGKRSGLDLGGGSLLIKSADNGYSSCRHYFGADAFFPIAEYLVCHEYNPNIVDDGMDCVRGEADFKPEERGQDIVRNGENGANSCKEATNNDKRCRVRELAALGDGIKEEEGAQSSFLQSKTDIKKEDGEVSAIF